MKKKYYILFICFIVYKIGLSQTNSIKIISDLDNEKSKLKIQQEIIYYNNSNSILRNIYLHNWANSYRDSKTPLSKRFIKDYNKTLYFANEKNLGFSKIIDLKVNLKNVVYSELENQADIIKITLNSLLYPNRKVKITVNYIVKIPSDRFTGYGKTRKDEYRLRNWYLAPAVFQGGWQLMSNLNLDDLYESSTDFSIKINVPKNYEVESNLFYTKEDQDSYHLTGKNITNAILDIYKKSEVKSITTESIVVKTDIYSKNLGLSLMTDLLNRELSFLEEYLGKYPDKEVYIDRATQSKNPVYGLNQLPKFLRPFSDSFEWDITFFKELSKRYVENKLRLNKRKDYWIIDGIQNYLMLEYVEKYYPDVKMLGKVSDFWLIRSFNVSKLKFNDKYPFVYQFSARKYLDQALNTPANSLSNFNRKIVSKYKAGLGIKFLKEYVGEDILNSSIYEFYQKNNSKLTSSDEFQKIISSKTSKNLDWFFGDFIKTSKKIDHTIDAIKIEKDSINVIVKNKRNITTPAAVYAIKNNKIIKRKWISNLSYIKNVKFVKDDYDSFVLNYENLYPEYNTLNNWKRLNPKFFNKPFKFSFFRDVIDPNYIHLFYEPSVKYNLYNGLIFGAKLHNKPIIKRNFEFRISPSYATKSNTIIGSFETKYNHFYEKTKLYKITYGMSGITLDYAPNLTYKALIPSIKVDFKRNSLRDNSDKTITAKLVHIEKEIAPDAVKSSEDNYSVFNLNFNYEDPDIIKEFRYSFNLELAQSFTKTAIDFQYRTLTKRNRQLDFRLFVGFFINNKTDGDYFSFGLDRSNDYLFQLNYIGRSETLGFFSQQYIITEGGFKSILSTRFANQYMVSTNFSVGLWRWLEFYKDLAVLKNKGKSIYFAYENGIRFNFVHNIFEFYFPIFSNNGLEFTQHAYPQKIRFTLTTDFNSIYNFFRRGLL